MSVKPSPFALLLALLTACGPASIGGDEPSAIDDVFSEYASADGPGCSVGVIQAGRMTLAKGFGMANLDYGIPNGPETVFRTGSVSKQFTAGAVALLALEGLVDLEAPVRIYLPEFPDYPVAPTVRHLVHHTSGVRDYIVLMALAGNREEDFYTNEDVLAILNRQQELNFEPGSEFLYSNAGYFLLGEIVRRVSGQTLRAFAQEQFFGPLGMESTHFHDNHNEVVAHRAVGYRPTDTGFDVFATTLDMVGDGGIYTSVEDWARWNGNLDEGAVGGSQWVALMHRRGVLSSGDTIPYAFGIVHGEHRGLKTVSHGGSWVGFRAAMARYPEADHAFVALCNRSRIDPTGLLGEVAEIYLGDRMTAPAEEIADTESESAPEPDPRVDVPDRQRYVGYFYSPELDVTYFFRDTGNAGLTVKAGRRSPVVLQETASGTLTDDQGVTYRFSNPGAGRYRTLTVDAGRVKNLGFQRVGGPRVPT